MTGAEVLVLCVFVLSCGMTLGAMLGALAVDAYQTRRARRRRRERIAESMQTRAKADTARDRAAWNRVQEVTGDDMLLPWRPVA